MIRFDAIKIERFSRTPAGALRIDGVLSRAGVFAYSSPAGVVREYRPADVVTRQDVIESFRDLPVTRNHPTRMVDAASWHTVAVGHISNPRAEGDKVIGTVVVSRQDVIADIESGKLKELSPGYHVELEDKPGRTDSGEAYDKITTAMIVNHLAVLPPGTSRQGISLRLDSKFDQILEPDCTSPTSGQIGDSNMAKLIFRLDGKDHEVEAGSEAHIELVKKADARDAQVVALTAKVGTLEGTVAALTTERDNARKDAAEAPEKARAQLVARAELETTARKVLGADAKFDGKTDREIRELVCKSRDAKFDSAGKSDDYVIGMFTVFASQPDTSRQDAIGAVGNGAPPAPAPGAPVVLEPHVQIRKDSAEAYKTPLAFSR